MYAIRSYYALASDDMRGRRAFTNDAVRAADFLAGEFEAAGLSPLPGTSGFLQPFTVRSIRAEGARLIVNGTPLPDDAFAVRLAGGALDWARITSYNVCYTKLLRSGTIVTRET